MKFIKLEEIKKNHKAYPKENKIKIVLNLKVFGGKKILIYKISVIFLTVVSFRKMKADSLHLIENITSHRNIPLLIKSLNIKIKIKMKMTVYLPLLNC